ncbi:LTA synthase family protein [Brevibacillus fulvus]|uniref:Phosphoglycerol transferase MdoB-like AlkP superfamily enzyme n=1 Tax=Brevibacillus fulvus TaxID=1125967 RepID=A0A938XVS8_9BACL|nr:LTA synthase family protein [Brevibacillus fulvus]MBM7589014.1 phosphoglycerol transferase MdoB-like AlkP superfamily enzyme [Brevibacillus fulvus]
MFQGEVSFISFLFDSLFLFVVTLAFEFLPKQWKNYPYLLINLLASTFFLGITMYYDFFGKMVNYYALLQLGQVGGIQGSVFSLLKPIYSLFYVDILLLGLSGFSKRVIGYTRLRLRKLSLAIVLLALVFVLSGSFVMIGHAESSSALDHGIFYYEAEQVLAKTAFKKQRKITFTNADIQKIKGTDPIVNPQYFGVAKDKNVIMIQLESFQNFLIGLKINGQEVTPNLNQLVKESYYFPRFFSQIGQGNTSDAEFIVNSSLYPLENGGISQVYGNKAFPSLPRLLNASGYWTATFHPNDVSFWNRDDLYPALGFSTYFDDDFFGKEDLVGMGASDEVLYRKTAGELQKHRGQKFYAHLISLSSHHPFEIPSAKLDSFTLPPDYSGTFLENYLLATHYADRALGQFIDQLKQDQLWDDTLFVVYGDHFGFPLDQANKRKSLVTSMLGRDYTIRDVFNVPFIVKVPHQQTGEVRENVGGQVDVLPTLANLLGIPLDKQIHFGTDLLNSHRNLLGERFYMPEGSFINDHVIHVDGKQPYNVPLDEQGIGYEPAEDKQRIQQLLKMSEEYMDALPEH